MRRLKKTTVLSVSLGGFALLLFVLFALSGSFLPLILALPLLVASGYARRRESYDEYRSRYEEKFGIASDTDDDAT